MAKVSGIGEPDDDVLFDGDWLTVRAMRLPNGSMPAKDWHDTELGEKGTGQFLAACKVLETSFRSARPPAGRWETIPTSKHRLHELKVTKPGSTPPHLRALGFRDHQTVWLACGFTKTKNKLKKQEIEQGDSITSAWREATAEEKR